MLITYFKNIKNIFIGCYNYYKLLLDNLFFPEISANVLFNCSLCGVICYRMDHA